MKASDDQNANCDDDKQISRMIKASREDADISFVRPSDASIEAYLLGTATAAQKNEIRKAMVISASFRHEALQMAKDIESLASPETSVGLDKATACPAPSSELTRALVGAGNQERESLRSRLGEWIVPWSFICRSGSLMRSIARFSGRRVAIAGLAVAALLVMVVVRSDRIGKPSDAGLAVSSWVEAARVDPGYFVSNITRRSSHERPLVSRYTSHEDAAIAEFSRMIRYEDGEYAIGETASAEAKPEGVHRLLTLKIVDDRGNTMARFERTATSDSIVPAIIRAWTMSVPSGVMHSIEMSADSVTARWDSTLGQRGCVTFTYGTGRSFAATTGILFDFSVKRPGGDLD